MRLAGTIWKFWWACSHLTEGRQQIGAALAIASNELIAPRFRIIAYKGSGVLAYFQHDFETARQMYEEGLALARFSSEPIETGSLLLNLGLLYTAAGDLKVARQSLEQALNVFSGTNFELGVTKCRWSIGEILEQEGDLDGARRLFEETLTYFESVEDLYNVGDCCQVIARLIRRQRREYLAANESAPEEELAWLRRSVKTYHSCGHGIGIADCLDDIAWVAAAEGRAGTAARLAAAAGNLRESLDAGLVPDGMRKTIAECTDRALTILGRTDFDAAWDAGRAISLDEAVTLALQDEAGT